jgi:hypothetical protein
MNTIITLIIALSVFGLYINLYSGTDLSDPELMSTALSSRVSTKENNERENAKISSEVKKIIQDLKLDPEIMDKAKDVSTEEIDEMIKLAEETNVFVNAPKKYNELGEKMSDVTDNRILNLGKNVKGGSSTRVYGWVRPSSVDKVDSNGSITKEDISYKNNYPYKTSELRMKSGDSKVLESINDSVSSRRFKQGGQIGTLILPKDTSAFDIDNTFTKRAASIYKTRIGFQNKILPDVMDVNTGLIKERDSPKLNYMDEMSDNIEIKTRPNLVGFKDMVDHMKTHEILHPVDKVNGDMQNISRNYNLK